MRFHALPTLSRRSLSLSLLALLVACGGSTGAEPEDEEEVDDVSPTVAITGPAAGEVDGVVLLTVDAADNVGVAFVRFRVNGGLLAEIDSVAPFSFTWNTATYSPGIYEWRAIATDSAGNSTTSAAVTYTFDFPAVR